MQSAKPRCSEPPEGEGANSSSAANVGVCDLSIVFKRMGVSRDLWQRFEIACRFQTYGYSHLVRSGAML